MRTFGLVVMVGLWACSTPKAPEARGEKVKAKTPAAVSPAAGTADVDPEVVLTLEELIPANAIGLGRMDSDLFPMLRMVDEFADPSEPCWPQLKAQLRAAYHVMLPPSTSAGRRDAYYIVEKDVSRAAIEQCAPRAFKRVGLEIKPSRNVTVFQTDVGTVSVAWRGRYVILGKDHQITAALRPQDASTAARWRPLVAQAPQRGPFWMLSVGEPPANLNAALGPDAKDIMITIEVSEPKPHPRMAGRFVAHYASANAAAKTLLWIKSWSAREQWPFVTEPTVKERQGFERLAKRFAKLRMTQQENRLEIAWDSDQLGGLSELSTIFATLDDDAP